MILFSQNELGNLKVQRKWALLRAFGERLVSVDTRNELLTAKEYVRESLELVSYLLQNDYCQDMSTKSDVITSYGYPAGSSGSDYYQNCNADLQFISKTLVRYMGTINERLSKLRYYKGERRISARKTSLVSVLNVPLMQLTFQQGYASGMTQSPTPPTRGTALVNRTQQTPRVEEQLTMEVPLLASREIFEAPQYVDETPTQVLPVKKDKELLIAGGVILGVLLISNM